ncbi:cyclic nucleotide-binding domain-containing protein [Actinomadura latina]|uniref:Cyclic nucleotide-binding domain-containing protein n=1 Tax=Actinomadura latina TaxID=163603 RepID=A0A846YPR7_9ACTN|nr:cyclic nucleotide-binding domain-containing protein [Actinomadura latina]NKZ02161.1 cyclic nucleotide-binding domain-containing protein [Actinomadura latina]
MDERAHRHDPDQIVHPETRIVRPRKPHDEFSAENTGLETENTDLENAHEVAPAPVRPDVPSKRPGFWLSLTTIERAEFLATAQEVMYPAGAVLWEEGQAADHTIVIKFGTVRVCVERDGHERIIAFRGPGDIIGERAALMLRRRSATIVAMEPLHALRLTTQQFVTYLSNHPRVVAVMEREMYDRLTEQPGSTHDHQNSEARAYRAAHAYSYGSAVQYGSHQVYATAYVPVPPLSPRDPHTSQAPYPAAARVPSYTQPTQPMAIDSSAPAGPSWAGQNCTIVFTDIAGFSSRVRDETDRIEVRRAMYAALRESFGESGVPWDACYSEDRGDGALIVVPPGIPTAAVIDPMIAVLGMRLRRHNHRSSEAVRVQLRVALDVGPVMPDPPGVSGWTIITAARLLDAAPLKERLAATGADLGFIASRFVYDSVIAHSPGYVNADEYEPIGCRVKETDIEGWIHLRGLPARSAL